MSSRSYSQAPSIPSSEMSLLLSSPQATEKNGDNSVHHGASRDRKENRTLSSGVNTPWRIQEARKVFALMREEYEESKKLSVRKRYLELQRIIQMFTAEPITQRLHYLTKAESELRHSRAVQFSQHQSLSTINGAVHGRMLVTSSISEALHTRPSARGDRSKTDNNKSFSSINSSSNCESNSSNKSSIYSPSNSYSTESSDSNCNSNTNGSCSNSSSNNSIKSTRDYNIFYSSDNSSSASDQSNGSLSSNQRSFSRATHKMLNSIDNTTHTDSLWWRRKRNKSFKSPSSQGNHFSLGGNNLSSNYHSPSSFGDDCKTKNSQFAPTISIEGAPSNTDPSSRIDNSSVNSPSLQEIRIVCCKAYNFFVDKVSPRSSKSTEFHFGPCEDLYRVKSASAEQPASNVSPEICSFESPFASLRRQTRAGGRSNLSPTGRRSLDLLDVTSGGSNCSSPSFNLKLGGDSRKSSVSSPNQHGTPQTASRLARNVFINSQAPEFCIPSLRLSVGKRSPVLYSRSPDRQDLVGPARAESPRSSDSPQRQSQNASSCSKPRYFLFDKHENQPLLAAAAPEPAGIDRKPLRPTIHGNPRDQNRGTLKTHGNPRSQNNGDRLGKRCGDESVIGRVAFSEEQFFQKTGPSVHQRRDMEGETGGSAMDNLVLTIAQDHLTSLRENYKKLDGANRWRRYRAMKSMIKSCMNVMK